MTEREKHLNDLKAQIDQLGIDMEWLAAGIEHADKHGMAPVDYGFANAAKLRHRAKKLSAEYETLTAEYESLKNSNETAQTKIIWTGKKRELADWILAGKLESTSPMNALEKAIAHIEMKDGSTLSARSLWQSLKNREDLEGK